MRNSNINMAMRSIEFVAVVVAILFSVTLGCVQEPVGTPTPTVSPTPIETPLPTPTIPPFTPTPSVTPALVPVNYIVWIDSDFGFYKIRAVKENTSIELPPDFDILNFTINVGDKVRWMNDDSYDFPLTLVSNEGLWTGRTGLMRWQGERFEYTFNETGIYTFSIKEFTRIKNQKITVS